MSIKSKLISILLFSVIIITLTVGLVFKILIDDIFYKDAQIEMQSSFIQIATDINSIKNNLIESTPLFEHNLNVEKTFKNVEKSNPIQIISLRKEMALELLKHLQYSSLDEVYIYDKNNQVIIFAAKKANRYFCAYRYKDDFYISQNKQFKKSIIDFELPQNIHKSKNPFSMYSTTGHFRVVNNQVDVLSHKIYTYNNNYIGAMILMKKLTQSHIDTLLKNLHTNIKIVVKEDQFKSIEKKYGINLLNDDIYITPLLANIEEVEMFNSDDEYISFASIPTENKRAFFINTIKHDLVNEANFQNIILLFLIVAIFSIVLFVIGAYFVNKLIQLPLLNLLRNIRKIEKADYDLEKHISRNDEIGEISKTMFSMAEKIKSREAHLDSLVKAEVEKNRLKDKQIIQQSRLAQIGEMISMIAHQWRQPLGAISATSIDLQMKIAMGNARNEKMNSEEFCGYVNHSLKQIDSFVETLSTTIDDFRNFYKPNKEITSTKLKDVIENAVKIMKSSLDGNGIKLVYEYITDDKMMVYKNELIQVFLNLLKNAQDNFIEKNIENPQIKIIVDANKIIFSDNGGGIDETIIDNIFDPYFSTKEAKNGTGLGLYMSKTIIHDHHHGDLRVINKNGGAWFIIELGELG